ncbi:MAG: hypothetical protein AAGC74_06445 [Verrucomicrobiota bacterium]
MSSAESIFSSPPSSNGDAPANPFASLGTPAASNGEAKVESPFAAVNNSGAGKASPFGFEEEPAPTVDKIPPKREVAEPEVKAMEENPFQAAAAAAPAAGDPFQSAAAQPAAAAVESPFAPRGGLDSAATLGGAAMGGFEAARPTGNGSAVMNGDSAVAPAAAAPAPAPAPTPAPVAEPVAAAPAPTPAPQSPLAPAAASQPAPRGQSTQQLELRAIFGSEKVMTREEILQKAKNLAGIRELVVVGPSEMTAVQTLGGVMTRFGYGDQGSWQINTSGGVVDFVTAESTTLAIMREGRYSPGVWETLMIVARELGKLG